MSSWSSLPSDFDKLMSESHDYLENVEIDAAKSVDQEKSLPEDVKTVQRRNLLKWRIHTDWPPKS